MTDAAKFSKEDLEEALRAMSSTISKCEKVQPKLKQGTSQHTLLCRRIKALRIASALIRRELDSCSAGAIRPGKAAIRSKSAPKVLLLSGGNPQVAKAEGDTPVQTYISAMPGWKRNIGKRLDSLIARNVPNVRKAVKWNSPFYGIEGQGWFLAFHVYTRYVKVTFLKGTSLQPIPPGASKHKEVRYVDIHEDDLDEAQMVSWVKQAAALPGWVP